MPSTLSVIFCSANSVHISGNLSLSFSKNTLPIFFIAPFRHLHSALVSLWPIVSKFVYRSSNCSAHSQILSLTSGGTSTVCPKSSFLSSWSKMLNTGPSRVRVVRSRGLNSSIRRRILVLWKWRVEGIGGGIWIFGEGAEIRSARGTGGSLSLSSNLSFWIVRRERRLW